MAESDSILQLGIEAARDGNKEEARNLFRLLTRQEPQNAQAWLWLAGVAENREERQAALERVVQLDPDNDMAWKGLQALGVSPTSQAEDEAVVPSPMGLSEPPLPEPSTPSHERYDPEVDDPFAELDMLSEAMSESPEAVRRHEPAVSTPKPDYRGRVDAVEEDEETEPMRGGVNPLLVGLVVLAFIILLAVVFWPRVSEIAQSPQSPAPAAGTSAAVMDQVVGPPAGGEMTAVPTGVSGAVVESPEGAAPGDEAAPGEGAAPGDEAAPTTEQTTPVLDLAEANPTLVSPGTPLEKDGWQYEFSQPTYATPLIGGIGDVQPQGRLVVVLLLVTNNTGQSQLLPADFFVLKDAQGRVYEPKPQASSAYVNLYGRGIAADLSQEDPVPTDGLLRSIPIVFDVAPDATELVFFARSNPDQGWLVLQSV